MFVSSMLFHFVLALNDVCICNGQLSIKNDTKHITLVAAFINYAESVDWDYADYALATIMN